MATRRTFFKAATGAAAGALALSACGNSSSDGETTITFLHAHQGAFDDAIAAFEESHPEIKVEQEAVPFDEMISQVQARLGAGDDSLDVVAVDPPRLPNMVSQEFLDPVSDEAASQMKEVVSEVGFNSVTWDNGQWAYPVWTSDNLLFFNRSALSDAGVDEPGASAAERMTWEELLADARTVAEASSIDYGFGIEQVNRYYALQPMIMSIGASAGLEGDPAIEPSVNTEEWNAFGEWYAELFESGLSPRGVGPEQMPTLFQGGQLAYFLAGPTFITEFEESDIAGNWGVAPHPYFEAGEIVTPTDSWAVGVSAHSAKKEAAHAFAEFATLTTEGASLMSANDNLPPVHTEAYDEFTDRMTDTAGEAVEFLDEIITVDSEEHAEHRPSSVGYVDFETNMNDAFSDIANGGEVAQILDTAQETLVRQLERYTE